MSKEICYILTRDGTALFTDTGTALELVHHPKEMIYHDGSEYVIDKVEVGKAAVDVYVTKVR